MDEGLNDCEISRQTGLPRGTVRDWRQAGIGELIARRGASRHVCDPVATANASPRQYSYLLGQYLGDGTISSHPRGVFRLRIFCCSHYPKIVDRVRRTMVAVLPNRVNVRRRRGVALVEVSAYWKHVPCLFPHGPGRKHERRIALASWQDWIVEEHPKQFLRGLIESDGCRVINRVNGGEYPRYMFCNVSDDIRALFTQTLEQLGVRWTSANARNIAVSRRDDVAFLDSFIGPKR